MELGVSFFFLSRKDRSKREEMLPASSTALLRWRKGCLDGEMAGYLIFQTPGLTTVHSK